MAAEHREHQDVAFYCVSSSVYFLGAVAMLNSLRLVGHGEPVYLLDCGLTAAQRRLLAPHVTLVSPPRDAEPYMLKTIAPLRHPAEVMVLIDADMILTRPLSDLSEIASEDRIVAFRNLEDRFVPEWGELLDLGPVRRQPYLSSGLVFLGGAKGEEVLRLLDDRHDRVDFDLGYVRRNVAEYPFLLLDQDVLNAILASRVAADRVVALDNRLAPEPPFPGLAVVDEEALRCSYDDGTEPYVLHYVATRKPWLKAMALDVYARLLRRLLVGRDVPLRMSEGDLPVWMRHGVLASATRARIRGRERIGWFLRRNLPRAVVARVDAFRLRRGAWGR